MIKLNNARIEQITNEKAIGILLSATSSIPISVRFKLSNMEVALSDAVRAYTKLRQILIEEFCDKDDTGKPKVVDGSQYTFEKNWQAWTKAFAELLEQEVTIDQPKVAMPLSILEKVEISAHDLTILSSIIDFIDDIEDK
jgi:hypothetical protein